MPQTLIMGLANELFWHLQDFDDIAVGISAICKDTPAWHLQWTCVELHARRA